ncbi:4283_t:CDS:2 [Acaulospora colombiana]|uniref:4283_t:CDS:1 n=1 Tax=Acaulospora colombiana TaxID=27376 RepID=A0ACA9NS75_9GLOM|nr:4283_t:CDS:2 [Acaulospora colombiana]
MHREANIQLANSQDPLHLDPAQGSRTDELQASLWALLKVVGQQLTSLYLPWANSTYELHSDIWDLCPNLEHLYTAMKLTRPPPFEHPIHTLCIASSRNYMYLRERPFPDWINLRIIRTDVRWDRSESLIYSMAWVKTCAERNIRLEDATGESYDEFIERTGKIQDKSEGEKSSTYSEQAANAGQEVANANEEVAQPIETVSVAPPVEEVAEKQEDTNPPDANAQPPSSPIVEDPIDNVADNEVIALEDIPIEPSAPNVVESESPFVIPLPPSPIQDSAADSATSGNDSQQAQDTQSAQAVTPKVSAQEVVTTNPAHLCHDTISTTIENEVEPLSQEVITTDVPTGIEEKEKECSVTHTTDSSNLPLSSPLETSSFVKAEADKSSAPGDTLLVPPEDVKAE